MSKEREIMSFEVDNKKHSDLWDKIPEYKGSTTADEPQIKPETSETNPKIVRTDKKERKIRQQRISFIFFAIAFLVTLSLPFAIGQYRRWQEENYEKEHEDDPSVLQNSMYTNAFCTNIAYPKGVTFVSYQAQGFVKPYGLTIHVKGSAVKSEYNMIATMAFNVFKDLGTVIIIEDETGNEYIFQNSK